MCQHSQRNIQQKQIIYQFSYRQQLNFIPKKRRKHNMACVSQQLKRTDHGSDIDFGTPVSHKNRYNQPTMSNKKPMDVVKNNQREESTAHENKLPINLFLTAAEYNKMLITNGRSLRKCSEPPLEDYVGNLEFINDTIFQSCEQKREVMRMRMRNGKEDAQEKGYINFSDRKNGKANSVSSNCGCCCCEQYCKICAKERQNQLQKLQANKKLSQHELEKALEKIKSQPLKSKTKPYIQKHKKKVITSEANIKASINSEKNKKNSKNIENSQKQCSSSYLSHKSFNIDNLLYKSLLQFEQTKRQNKIKHIEQKREKIERQNLLKQFEQAIRQQNKQYIRKNKSVSKQKRNKSASSYNIRNGYWQSIKDNVAKELYKEKLAQKGKKNGAGDKDKLSKSAVNCTHEVKIPAEMIEVLRAQRQRQAKEKIAKQRYQVQQKKKKIQKHLQQLQKHRRHQINSCEKKKFQPSPQMIEQAFKNIVEEGKVQPKQGNGNPSMRKIKS